MDTIRLVNKKTGREGDYDICLGNTPQTIEVYIEGGEGRGYTSLKKLAEDYEILPNKKGDE